MARLFFAQRSAGDAVQALVERQRAASIAERTTLHVHLHRLPTGAQYQTLVLQWRLRQVEAVIGWLDACAAPQPGTALVAYPIAALTDSANPMLAHQFVAYVCSSAGQQVLVQHGFIAADTTAAPPAAPHTLPTEPAPRVLRVFAAASLTSAFEVLGAAFGTQHPGVEIIFSFAGSHHLAQQLANGPPADVFAAAHRTSMDAAIQMGRVQTGSERICAYNRLAVVTGRTNSLPFHSLGDLAQPGRRLVFGSDATAVGHYALDLLEQVDHAGAFGARGRLAVLQNVVGYAATPRAVLERIIAGEADAGIVFVSDYHSAADQVRSPVIYPTLLPWSLS
ncbi:MAG: molybdate ABC transporter substrate-binding protein [Chloroflexaceae bacterium]|nr:molybdate ABC transporter substrate-binding protein [Chloroflexaceae bacterium]